MLCRADSIGVFQVGVARADGHCCRGCSRGGSTTSSIEIALIRPGPIQGGAVHPFVRRKLGQRAGHLCRTRSSSPCSSARSASRSSRSSSCRWRWRWASARGEDADLLRRAMGSKRGVERIESLREKLYEGMADERPRRARTPTTSTRKIQAFANFGFAGVALAVVRAARLRELVDQAALPRRVPRRAAARAADGLLLARDARRPMRGGTASRCSGPTCMRSGVEAVLEPVVGCADPSAVAMPADADAEASRRIAARRPAWTACTHRMQPPVGPFDLHAPDESADHRRDGALRGAAGSRRGQGHRRGGRRAHRRRARRAAAPTATCATSCAAPASPAAQLEALATAGAFECLGLTRREAIWLAGSAAAGPRRVPPRFARRRCSRRCSPIRRATSRLAADLWATGVSTDDHPMTPLPVRARRARGAHLERAARRTRPAGASRSRDS